MLSPFEETYVMLIEYSSIRGGNIQNYASKDIRNIFHSYIDAHSHRLIDDYPGYVLEATTGLQSQFSRIIFSDKNTYNRLFQQVLHKVGES